MSADNEIHDPRAPIEESELLARLAALPAPALDPGRGKRIHSRARAAFVRSSETPAWLALLVRVYGRIEPTMATAVASGYLLWAFQSAMSLHQ
jgi:hypothetical protein